MPVHGLKQCREAYYMLHNARRKVAQSHYFVGSTSVAKVPIVPQMGLFSVTLWVATITRLIQRVFNERYAVNGGFA